MAAPSDLELKRDNGSSLFHLSFSDNDFTAGKMSVIDILFRLDDISKKYEKYDIDKQRAFNANSEDAFARLFNSFEDQIEAALNKSEMAAMEQNRAKLVAMNAEIRRVKARLIEEVPKLQRLSQKKVKGLTKEDLQDRADLVLALPDRIRAIPDGTTSNTKASGASTSKGHVKFDSDENFGDGFFEQSEESSQFREEYDMRKLKQDEGLDIISDGLDTLKNLAHDMNEELDRQVPLVDEIDTKVDKASSEIRNTNVRLKKTITQIRSSRNIIIDVILTCVLLGIISYLYNVLAM